MSLSLKEKWDLYTKDITSPQIFIDHAFYYIIAAAVQRRVWIGPEHKKLFPNQYIILCADSGIGKGITINPCLDLLRFHKLERANAAPIEPPVATLPEGVAESISPELQAQLKAANFDIASGTTEKPKASLEKPLVIPLGSNSTTFEALTDSLSRATRHINFKQVDKKTGNTSIEIYTHSSIVFGITEMGSLFKKHKEDVVTLLLDGYDCVPYEYRTKKSGVDILPRPCINLLAGTTPEFMQSAFDDNIIGQGMAGRTIFACGIKNRFESQRAPELTDEQIQAKDDILVHIKKLTELYGNIKVSKEADDYFEEWWKNFKDVEFPKVHDKLKHYYSRLDIHVKKFAIAMVLASNGDKDSMGMPLAIIEKEHYIIARIFLAKTEKTMLLALDFADKNNIDYRASQKIVRYLTKQGPQKFNTLWNHVYDIGVDKLKMKEVLEYLLDTGKIDFDSTKATYLIKEAKGTNA